MVKSNKLREACLAVYCVYIATSSDNPNIYKIGHTRQTIEARESQLHGTTKKGAQNVDKIVWHHAVPFANAEHVEIIVHEICNAYNIPIVVTAKHREWFDLKLSKEKTLYMLQNLIEEVVHYCTHHKAEELVNKIDDLSERFNKSLVSIQQEQKVDAIDINPVTPVEKISANGIDRLNALEKSTGLCYETGTKNEKMLKFIKAFKPFKNIEEFATIFDQEKKNKNPLLEGLGVVSRDTVLKKFSD